MDTNSKPSKVPVIVVSSIAVLSIAAASAFGFLYFSEKNKPAQVVTQTVTKTTAAPSGALPTSVTLLTSKQASEKYTAGKDDKAVSYSTDIGNFSLSLPSSLGIVQEFSTQDGNGSQTRLSIGKRTGSLITYPSVTPFTLHAVEISKEAKIASKLGSTDNSSAYKYLIKEYGLISGSEELDDTAKETKTSIAAQEALDYETTGMFMMHYIAFHKNDTLYVISYDSDNESGEEILKLINKGLELKS